MIKISLNKAKKLAESVGYWSEEEYHNKGYSKISNKFKYHNREFELIYSISDSKIQSYGLLESTTEGCKCVKSWLIFSNGRIYWW